MNLKSNIFSRNGYFEKFIIPAFDLYCMKIKLCIIQAGKYIRHIYIYMFKTFIRTAMPIMYYDFIILLQKVLNVSFNIFWRKNMKFVLYGIYSTTFSRYFVYDCIKLILSLLLLLRWAIWPVGLLFEKKKNKKTYDWIYNTIIFKSYKKIYCYSNTIDF